MRAPRSAVAAIAILLLAAGCGDDDSGGAGAAASDPASVTTTTTPAVAPVPAGDAVELDLTAPTRTVAGPFTWTMTVTNTTENAVTLTFPTGQQGDAVLRAGESVVHRWSDGRFFTQAVTEVQLQPGEALNIELADDLGGVEPGWYDVEASVAVVGAPGPVAGTLRVTSS